MNIRAGIAKATSIFRPKRTPPLSQKKEPYWRNKPLTTQVVQRRLNDPTFRSRYKNFLRFMEDELKRDKNEVRRGKKRFGTWNMNGIYQRFGAEQYGANFLEIQRLVDYARNPKTQGVFKESLLATNGEPDLAKIIAQATLNINGHFKVKE